MVKTFKRIAALAMAIALVVCFAVSASAAIDVQTTTQYAANQDNVNVTVNVSGIEGADYVTYYATKGDDVVYVDQETVSGSGTATIKYQTAATNLNGEVKVGYTNGAATDWNIDGYTVSAGSYAVTPSVIPKTGTATVTITYTATDGYEYDTVEVEGADGVATLGDGAITVTLSNIKGNVTLDVKEKEATTSNVKVVYLDGAGKTLEGGNRQFTVLGQVNGIGEDDEYGIAVSANKITVDTIGTADVTTYKALDKNAKGTFAVQLIDEGVAGADEILIATDGTYYAAIYAKVGDNYTIVACDEPITVE